MNLPIQPHQSAIMRKPSTLHHLADAYLGLTPTPTPAGLAVALGFTSVPAMIKAVEDPAHPQESRDTLSTVLTLLEDRLTVAGLLERTHPAFTKYIMSARLNVVEPKAQPEDRAPLQINILGVGNTHVTLEDLV